MRELRTLPKSHLHLHFTGSARLATIREFAYRYGISLPPALANQDFDWGDGGQDWSYFQGRYEAARQTIRSAEDVRRIIREAAEDDVTEGSGWLELQVDPSSYARHLGGVNPAVEVMVDACQDASRATGIGIGLVLAVSWSASPEHAERMARVAARYAHRGVVGFGISNDERLGEPDTFVSASHIARDAGLVVTPHTGFYTDYHHVRRCVELLGARRIGHGITAALSSRTLDLLAQRQVTMEICPTSYLPLGVLSSMTQLPVAAFRQAGIPVALAADDPLIFGTRLVGQYEILRAVHGLDDQALAGLARQAVGASTAPLEVAKQLLSGIDAWVK
ncbi:MAG: adenosine deaminase [Pseudonocardiales bacterium]|nr:adenosine deaminase [Pseudonocardiales bacterium]MBV9650187.1 adenosine deaminase [Pseudonocardiales bacterium]